MTQNNEIYQKKSPILNMRQKQEECKDVVRVFLATIHTSMVLMFITHSFILGQLYKSEDLCMIMLLIYILYRLPPIKTVTSHTSLSLIASHQTFRNLPQHYTISLVSTFFKICSSNSHTKTLFNLSLNPNVQIFIFYPAAMVLEIN